jgi:leader peptidase (prepilin peptidase)/N-methyltransferase
LDAPDDSLATALGLVLATHAGSVAFAAFATLWGALWGSFFNVCIHRVGLYESVVHPRSRCPRCGRGIRALENIPVVSWLVLRGKCAGCALPISLRYPFVELLSAVLALVLWLHLAAQPDDAVHLLARFFVYFALVGTLLVLAGIDLDHLLIPDRITYPAIPIFFVLALLLRDVPPLELVLGPLAGYGLVFVTAEVGYLVLKREAMGYGDAKLLALVGAALGWRAPVFAFFTAPFLMIAVLVPILISRKRRLLGGPEVPFGPALAIMSVVYLFIADWLRLFIADWLRPVLPF